MKQQNSKFKVAVLFAADLTSSLTTFTTGHMDTVTCFSLTGSCICAITLLGPAVQNYLDKIFILPFSYISSTNSFYLWTVITLLLVDIIMTKINLVKVFHYLVTLKKKQNKDEMQKKVLLLCFQLKNNNFASEKKKRKTEEKLLVKANDFRCV